MPVGPIKSLDGNVKGSVLTSRLAFVRAELGKDALDRVLARLPVPDRVALTGIIVPMAWLPFAMCERLGDAIAAEVPGDKRLFRRLGERSAKDNLTSFHRAYVRRDDPHAMLADAPSLYRLYYDTGQREYVRLSDHEALLCTIGSKTFSPADCDTVAGWYEAAIGICGGQDAQVTETKCRTRGDPRCEYVCRWL